MIIYQGDYVLRKEKKSDFLKGILDTNSELTLILRDPKCHCSCESRALENQSQVISGVLAQVLFIMVPEGTCSTL